MCSRWMGGGVSVVAGQYTRPRHLGRPSRADTNVLFSANPSNGVQTNTLIRDETVLDPVAAESRREPRWGLPSGCALWPVIYLTVFFAALPLMLYALLFVG